MNSTGTKPVTQPDGFTAYGVDGCRSGWFVVRVSPDGSLRYCVAESIEDVVAGAAETDRVFIDIPIGLPNDEHERRCDKEARAILKAPRASSVFRAPVRTVFTARDHKHAGDLSAEVTGKRLTQQAWGIVPKIRQVDEMLRGSAKARRIVREIHPEVCFWGLAGKAMLRRKQRMPGFDERLAVLNRLWPAIGKLVDCVLRYTLRKDVARDDILDAVVAALVACQPDSELRTVPSTPEIDECGLPMEMVFTHGPGASNQS